MDEKTYYIAPYLGPFGAYLMPQLPIQGSKCVSIYQKDRCNVAFTTHFLHTGQKQTQITIWMRKLTIYQQIWAHLGPIKCPYRVQKVFSYTKMIAGTWWLIYVIFNMVKKLLVLVKNNYMVEKTYHLAPYFSLFEAYFKPY